MLTVNQTYDFIWPCTDNVTSPFRPSHRPNHNGIDLSQGINEPIYASAGGWVSRSYVSTSYGEVIFIKHNIDGFWYETVYAHLLEGSRLVFEDDVVTQGQQIGIMGNTGQSSGTHLHFELNIPDWVQGGSNAVDPIPYLEGQPGGHEIVCKNEYLTKAEMYGNASHIATRFLAEGWNKASIAGMLGNMERESTMSPCLWEGLDQGNMSVGFGLVQWTPASLMHNWANSEGRDPTDINAQIDRIIYEKANGLEWYTSNDGFPHALPETWDEYISSSKTPEELAEIFMENYERPHRDYLFLQERQENARYWYNSNIWDGSPIDPPTPTVDYYTINRHSTNMRRMGVRGRR